MRADRADHGHARTAGRRAAAGRADVGRAVFRDGPAAAAGHRGADRSGVRESASAGTGAAWTPMSGATCSRGSRIAASACSRNVPSCGACYDSAAERCERDGAELTLTLPIERTLDGKYRLDRALGRGGFGAVFEASDLRLQRQVAAKVMMGSHFGDPDGAPAIRARGAGRGEDRPPEHHARARLRCGRLRRRVPDHGTGGRPDLARGAAALRRDCSRAGVRMVPAIARGPSVRAHAGRRPPRPEAGERDDRRHSRRRRTEDHGLRPRESPRRGNRRHRVGDHRRHGDGHARLHGARGLDRRGRRRARGHLRRSA